LLGSSRVEDCSMEMTSGTVTFRDDDNVDLDVGIVVIWSDSNFSWICLFLESC